MNELKNLSTGGDTGAPMKEAPVKTEVTRLRAKPTNTRDFLAKSKLVVSDGKRVEPEATPGKVQGQPKTGEGVKNEPDEVLISGPGLKQQPKSSTGSGSFEAPKGEETAVAEKVKIGESEYTVEQINAGMEALKTREKDDENRRAWQGNLTKKSQIVSALSDQQLQEVLPYVTSSRKLPENIGEELKKLQIIPETLTLKDSDGYETTIKTADIPEEFLDKAVNAALALKWPEYAEVVKERDRLKAENEQITSSVTKEQYGRGVQMAVEFMKNRPETAITLRKSDDLKVVLANIMTAGPDHPEYENAVRFGIVLKAVNDGFMPDMDTAYDILVGGVRAKNEAASQILANQGAPIPERPGNKPPFMDEGRTFLERNRSVKGQKMMKLGR